MTSCLHELRNPSLIKNRLLLVAYGCNQMLPTAIFSTPFMVIDKTGVTSDWVKLWHLLTVYNHVIPFEILSLVYN